MKFKKITKNVVIITIILLLIYDIYVMATPEVGDTISEFIREISHKYLAIPFTFGFLMGHWFWGKD